MPWIKAIFVVVVLCVGFQYGLLFSKFSRGSLAKIDFVTLVASTVVFFAAAYTILFQPA